MPNERNVLRKTSQSVPQDQKSVNFLHNVISLTQLLHHFKHAAEVYLTFRSHVKIFLSHSFSDNVSIVVFLKNLSIITDWSKKNNADPDETAPQGAV